MKACFTVLLVMLLVPLLFVTSIVTAVSSVLFDDNTYKNILSDSNITPKVTETAAMLIKDELISTDSGYRSFLDTPRANTLMQTFVEKLRIPEYLTDSLVGVVQYVNEKSSNIDIYVQSRITDQDVADLKDTVVQIFSETYTDLKRCNTDAEYQQFVTRNQVPTCRPPSISVNEIVANMRTLVDKNIDLTGIKDVMSGKLPLDAKTKTSLTDFRNFHSIFQNILLAAWAVVGALILLIILLNIFGGLTFAGYLSTSAFTVSIFIGVLGLLAQLFANSNIQIRASDLKLSDAFSLDTGNSLASTVTDVLKKLSQIFYVNLYFWAGAFFVASILFFILKFILNRISDRSEVVEKKEYYIPAYTKPVAAPVSENPNHVQPIMPTTPMMPTTPAQYVQPQVTPIPKSAGDNSVVTGNEVFPTQNPSQTNAVINPVTGESKPADDSIIHHAKEPHSSLRSDEDEPVRPSGGKVI